MFYAGDEYTDTNPELDDYTDPYDPNAEPCPDCGADPGEPCASQCPNTPAAAL